MYAVTLILKFPASFNEAAMINMCDVIKDSRPEEPNYFIAKIIKPTGGFAHAAVFYTGDELESFAIYKEIVTEGINSLNP